MKISTLRLVVYWASYSMAIIAFSILALGGFLTMDPPLVGGQVADTIRMPSFWALGIAGALALLTKPQNGPRAQ